VVSVPAVKGGEPKDWLVSISSDGYIRVWDLAGAVEEVTADQEEVVKGRSVGSYNADARLTCLAAEPMPSKIRARESSEPNPSKRAKTEVDAESDDDAQEEEEEKPKPKVTKKAHQGPSKPQPKPQPQSKPQQGVKAKKTK